MNCIYCENGKTKVRSTAKGQKGGVYRERICLSCRKVFYTKDRTTGSVEALKSVERNLHR